LHSGPQEFISSWYHASSQSCHWKGNSRLCGV